MFDLSISFEDITISSIVQEDIVCVQQWMNNQQFYAQEALNKPMSLKELQERFIEYYMSENEFFLKIQQKNNLIGIFKGRIEFKSTNEVLIWCYILDKESMGHGLGSKILNEILSYFKNKLGINSFSASIVAGSEKAVRFWSKNKFFLHRVSKNFFKVEDKILDMLVLRREGINHGV
jgi:RimJ/RimL family protein N-acetyltransferase